MSDYKEQAAPVEQESRSAEFLWLTLTKDRSGYVIGSTHDNIKSARQAVGYYVGADAIEVAVVRVDLSRLLWERP